jgi:hypothetical protein
MHTCSLLGKELIVVLNPVIFVLYGKLSLSKPYCTIKVLNPSYGPQLTNTVFGSTLFASIIMGMVLITEGIQGPGGVVGPGGGVFVGEVGVGVGAGVPVTTGVGVGVETGIVGVGVGIVIVGVGVHFGVGVGVALGVGVGVGVGLHAKTADLTKRTSKMANAEALNILNNF